MTRIVRLVVAGALASALLASAAPAATKMFVGFQDDRSFQLLGNRTQLMDAAKQANARILRSFVLWYQVAPKKPKNAANPADPAYQFGQLDEFVQNAAARGMDVLFTIWG